MTDQGDPNTENPDSPQDSADTAQPSTPAGDTSPQGASDSSSTGETKPRSGEVTADESKRFLSEIVAFQGLSKVGDQIAAGIQGVDPGGILITDDLSWAANDIFYLELRKKLNILLHRTTEVTQACHNFSEAHKEPEQPEEWLEALKKLEEGREKIQVGLYGVGLSGLLGAAAGSALGYNVASGISEGIKAVGDIIAYFRSDYEIKVQSLANVEDLYIQALVADKLRKKKRDVYLLNFNFIDGSPLIDDLGLLLEQHYQMLSCVEMIRSKFVDGKEAQVQALEAYLASLREKMVEYLVKVDEDVIETLRKEIDQSAVQLKQAQELRTPDSQITALENYVTSLRTKLLDELIKDIPSARAAVDAEIKKIIQQLEDKDNPNNKLTDVQVKALNDQLKLLQSSLADLLASTSANAKGDLKQEIEQVTKLLKEYQKTRLSDSQIASLESHLTILRAKLVDCLVKNDDDAKASLEKEIAATLQLIEISQKDMRAANGIINSSNKVKDAIDAFISSITTVPNGGTYPPLVSACIREYFAAEKIQYILKLKLLASGADFIIEKPPFYSRNVKTSYIGGGVVSYVMADREGKIVASGTVADVAAIDHKIGKEPEPLRWNIRTK